MDEETLTIEEMIEGLYKFWPDGDFKHIKRFNRPLSGVMAETINRLLMNAYCMGYIDGRADAGNQIAEKVDRCLQLLTE